MSSEQPYHLGDSSIIFDHLFVERMQTDQELDNHNDLKQPDDTLLALLHKQSCQHKQVEPACWKQHCRQKHGIHDILRWLCASWTVDVY